MTANARLPPRAAASPDEMGRPGPILGHIGVTVRDVTCAKAVYDAAPASLGIRL
jgi:hypothetical protein